MIPVVLGLRDCCKSMIQLPMFSKSDSLGAAAAGSKRVEMQRSRGFGHGVMASKICYNAVIVLSTVICDCCKPMNSCRD